MKVTPNKYMTPCQLKFIIEMLVIQSPTPHKEEVKTELLLHGLSMYRSKYASYVFVSLKHKMIDVVRKLDRRPPLMLVSAIQVPVDETTKHGRFIIAVCDVFNKACGTEKLLLWHIVKVAYETDEVNLTECIRMSGVSKRRGFEILRRLRHKILDSMRKVGRHELPDMQEVTVLYESLRKSVEGRRSSSTGLCQE